MYVCMYVHTSPVVGTHVETGRDRSLRLGASAIPKGMVHYEYMALAKKTFLREAMLLLFEAFEVRIAKCC